jgi:hypothetical protein
MKLQPFCARLEKNDKFKKAKSETNERVLIFSIAASDFGFVSDFGFRASDLDRRLGRSLPRCVPLQPAPSAP